MDIINKDDQYLKVGWIGTKLSSEKTVASFIIKGTFKIRSGQVVLPVTEDPGAVVGDIYYDEDDSRSLFYPSDFIPYKSRADLVVNATADTPNGMPKNHMTVGFMVGGYSKQLMVFGDRYWKEGVLGKYPGEAKPFTKMPITYESAFGGTEYQDNPLGKGLGTIEAPNIELLNYRLSSYVDNYPPAGFGALPQNWGQRMSSLGSYGKNYEKERWPCFPKDFNSRFFNSAPKDQQVKGYLRGDEPLVFQNLHPEYPEYRTALPSLKARCFIEKVSMDDQPGEFYEVKMNLDTLWVDMDAEKLVLVWRGLTEIQSSKLKEIKSVFVFTESLAEPKHNLQYYWELMQEAIAEEGAEFEIEERAAVDIDALMEERMGTFDAEIAQVEKEFAELETNVAAEEVKHLALIREKMGADAHLLDEVLSRPPANDMPQDVLLSHIESVRGERPDLAAQWEESINESANAEQEMAAMDAEAIAFGEDMWKEPSLTREDVVEASLAGKDLNDTDLSELDLSGLELIGMNFSGARLVKTNLSGSNMSNANLKGARLSKSDLTGINFSGAILDGTDLSNSVCIGAIFSKTSIEGTDFSKLTLNRANFSNSKGEYADFSGADLTEAIFTKANLPRSDFDGCQLAGADFREVQLLDADFAGVKAKGINMARANITGLRSGEQSDFMEANFEQVQGSGSQWEDCIFTRSNFAGANLTEALFEGASLEETMFDRAILTNVSFEEANLSQAVLTNANFLRASFERANLTKADFTGANLYEVAFLDTKLEQTNFYAANLKKTRLAW